MSQALNDFLQEEAEAWVSQFIQDRITYLRSRGIKSSGDLERSLQAEVIAGARSEGIKTLIAFEEYGRYIDMRKFDAPEGGGDYLLAIQDWISRNGLEQKFIRGYMKRRKLKKVPERILTYIAWGIARKRFKGKYRRRRWYNKSKSAAISELFRDIAANVPEVIANEVQNSLASEITRRNGRGPTKKGGISYQQFKDNLNRLNS